MKQFGCFQLDTQNECLWQNGVRLVLTPKPFAVLRYLVENPQRLVTHDELLAKLWPETYVQPQVLRTYVLELRKLLGDEAENPRFIRTVPKRGYWFLAQVEDGARYTAEVGVPRPGGIVGRRDEFDKMMGLLRHVKQGERQVLFITGEAGIGKTALIDAFCRQVCSENQIDIARGQSVEGFGGKEAYYPVTEVLGQLCRQNGGEKNVRVLQQKAPSWYAQVASLPHTDDSPIAASPVKHERLLKEICDAIEAMTDDKTVVLVLEDLHWADLSTLDLISALARRRSAAKLLLLSSYRPPVEAIEAGFGRAQAVYGSSAAPARQSCRERVSGPRIEAGYATERSAELCASALRRQSPVHDCDGRALDRTGPYTAGSWPLAAEIRTCRNRNGCSHGPFRDDRDAD
jgi:DNA-binding winged helix-turn-helix (wHTH) protein